MRANVWRMVISFSQSIFHVHNIINLRFHVVFFGRRLPALYSALSNAYFRDTANSCCRSSLRTHRWYVGNYVRTQPPNFPQFFPHSFGCDCVSFTIRCRIACILSTFGDALNISAWLVDLRFICECIKIRHRSAMTFSFRYAWLRVKTKNIRVYGTYEANLSGNGIRI